MGSPVSLKIGNSYSNIRGLTTTQFRELKDLLSYTVDAQTAYFSGRYGPRKKSLLDKHGSFPTGLLPRVKKYLANFSYTQEIEQTIPVVCPDLNKTNYSGRNLRPAQIEAVIACLSKTRGTVSMPTGTGKTMVIASLIEHIQVKTLIVVPTLEIKKQMTADFKSIFMCFDEYITIENIGSSALSSSVGYGMLIIDEAHHVAAKTYQTLNKKAWSTIPNRYFFTATPFRNDSEETLLYEAIAGEVLYQHSYVDAIKSKAIVPIEAYYYECPKIKPEGYTWAKVYSELVVKNNPRNVIIATILARLFQAEKSVLCLVKEVEHGKRLAELFDLPFISGQDEESRKYIRQFSNGEIKAVIATEGICSEGVDTRACEFVLVCGLGKAKSAFMQKVGRAVRNFPGKESAKVILFRDTSHKWCLTHFRAQAKILKDEYGVKPVKLEL